MIDLVSRTEVLERINRLHFTIAQLNEINAVILETPKAYDVDKVIGIIAKDITNGSETEKELTYKHINTIKSGGE